MYEHVIDEEKSREMNQLRGTAPWNLAGRGRRHSPPVSSDL